VPTIAARSLGCFERLAQVGSTLLARAFADLQRIPEVRHKAGGDKIAECLTQLHLGRDWDCSSEKHFPERQDTGMLLHVLLAIRQQFPNSQWEHVDVMLAVC
jgi:hypothetical protein